jgi:cytidine deaminase
MKKAPNFTELYEIAKSICKNRRISPLIEVGGVAAAISTESGNIYTGICIDTACSLGMCAERNVIANMLTNGESKIKKLVCYMEGGHIGSPCGACREYLMQLDEDSGNIEILIDYVNTKTVFLKELVPDWWGKRYFDAK